MESLSFVSILWLESLTCTSLTVFLLDVMFFLNVITVILSFRGLIHTFCQVGFSMNLTVFSVLLDAFMLLGVFLGYCFGTVVSFL